MMDRQQAQFAAERFWVGALKNAVIDGDVTKGSIMAGQSVGLMDKVMPLRAIIDEFIEEGEAELAHIRQMLR
jgi:enoyl-[acyl-carrier protein] reductase II